MSTGTRPGAGRRKLLQLSCAALACTVWAQACGGDAGTQPPEPPPDPPRPTTVTVSPATSQLTALGATVQLSAEVRDQNGLVMVVAVTWSSSTTSVATVSTSGLVTAADNGTATITAVAGAVSGSAAVTVAQQVGAVQVTPATGVVLPGTTLQLEAGAQDANGHAVEGSEFVWASSDTAVAVVDSTGLVAGVSLGEAEVSAISSGVAGRAQLEVVEPAPTTVAVSPDTVMFDALGDARRLVAEVRDQAARPMPDEVVVWSASDTLVTTVDASGLVTAVGNGSATVAATSGALTSVAAVEVMQVARRVTLSPRADTLILGDSLRLAAEALDGNGRPVADAAFIWSSSDANIAAVDTLGMVQGVGEGTAEITAATATVREVTRLTVFNPDRAPLVALYHATGGSNWVEADNWLTDKPLWQWDGVGTNARGRVIWANLSGERDPQGNWTRRGLKGTIPPELGRLDKLEQLWLYGNELSGTIPPELGALESLELLDLSHNELTGPIPPELGGLVKLKHLLLQNNSLDGALPLELGNLAELEVLTINGNDLSGRIPAALGDLATLTNLSLHDNGLAGRIPPELGNLASLKQLYLYGNELTGPIPSDLGRLSNLTQLWLGENNLSGPVPSELGNLTQLQGLVLYYNELSGPIPGELGNLTRLDRLALASNSLTGPIPVEFGRMTELVTLLLHTNELTGPIPSTLGNLEELTRLELQNNALTGSIPGELGGTALETFDLQANDLSGPLPAELGNLTGLKVLRVGDNGVTGSIPAEFGNLHALTRLELGGNALTGPIPAGLGELTALTHLFLEENDLEGPVPAEFGALTALREFTLMNNAGLKGMLSAGLTALTHLDVFLAAGTELCVPSEVDFETWLGGIYRHRIARCPDASPSAAYLTQTVQSREHPVPLVAGERALLRVFVTAPQTTREGIPPVRARFFVNDQETHMQDIAGRRSPIPTRVDESRLGRSANAVIPGRVIQPGLEMVIEVDPAGTLDPGLGVAKRIPETGRLRVDVHRMPTLHLTMVPFLWEEKPDPSIVELVREMAADPMRHELLHRTRTLLPIAALDVNGHEPVLTSTNSALGLLTETRVVRTLEGGSGHYMGLMAGTVTGAGGFAYQPGWSAFAVPHERAVSHELGHNLSLGHTPCGALSAVDPTYPHEGGVIGAWGYDFREASLVPPSTLDLMGCGPPNWTSDYHFNNALRFRLRDHQPPASADRVGENMTLLLWGGADVNGVPFLEPAFMVDAPASLPDAAGDYGITGRGADGAELFSLSFAMPAVPDGDGSSSFVFAIPVQSSSVGALTSITLTGPGGFAMHDGDTDRAIAILRDPRSGQVRGILRGASAEDAFRVAAMAGPGAERMLEVLFSRGLPGSGDPGR
ncbi:MAG: Ig-like domain-containing protein [Gemmatimonadota bacterium]|nr:Ig-like domain-containing protein [Gemmatimonadota bacterium]MDE2864297.1 Ig-like domain-containing protein [Gemmatimonadota bacterium]